MTHDESWYDIDALTAINQGLGRLIRCSNDFGVFALVDSRFAQIRYQNLLPLWLRQSLRVDTVAHTITRFKLFMENYQKKVCKLIE